MITKNNISAVLLSPPFCFFAKHGVFTKHYGSADEGFDLEYNVELGDFIYPDGVEADRNTTKDEYQNESFVVFLCVAQLFNRGYLPQHLKLEGRNYAGNDKGYCDILVKDNNGNPYLIIECKTANVDKKDDEFRKHWAKTMRNGDQLFRYFNTYRRAKYLCLYSADYPEYKKNGEKVHRFENIYHVISLVDNDEYLQTDNHLRSFREMREQQGGSEDFFNVWKQTYKQDYNTRGLLEPGIEAFNIGNKSYGVADLQTIDEYSLDKKYNEFALILRKHTISSHENAFDKLVNLFLAKIIDERYNSKELQLLWKGAAYDDYFSLQDRLINLYKRGMKEFFDDEVASVENWQIEDAFKFLTAKADEARDTIKKYFRRLKYFNNNPFAFLDVHNEQLFYKNAVILKDTISMLQDIYLTKNTDNQFLGDLFEGFLNRGVHQSEGQFFTPMPIVRFLVSSLPLRQIIESGEIPKAIDYACGAGHFLTEYARQIKPFIEEKMNLQNEHDPKAKEEKLNAECFKYFKEIVGIEKDYRLSKVSQVAAFMYGMDGIHIHYGDGLEETSDIKDHTFSVLVANPPYSVSGFMETLTEEERENFTLSQYVSNIEKNNSIETFFIERAAQLLKSGGVAAIVLPASVLTGTGLYMYAREILLKSFNVIAIACFGKNTFGQTSTSTVTLFLRRKDLEPDFAKHVQNRVDEWFKGNMADDGAYKDSEKLAAYIKHMGYSYDDYVKMLNNELTDTFLGTEIAQEYVKALNIKKQGKNSVSTFLNPLARNVRGEAQKFVKSRSYKDLTPAGKMLEESRYTLQFIREIEKEKLYYYLLTASNPQPVVVVQSPSDAAQEKKFLGYEWSNRKGDEGIHYLNTGKMKQTSPDDEDDDDETLSQIKGVNGIQTPLFNPLNVFDDNRINSLIRKNFCEEDFVVTDELRTFVSKGSLVDMIDFSRVYFSKEIKTTFTSKLSFFDEEKYELKSLGALAVFLQRGKNPKYDDNGYQVIKSGQARGGVEFDFSKTYYASNYDEDDKRILCKGDILINSTGVGTAGRVTFFNLEGKYVVDNHITILRTSAYVYNLYVFYALAYGVGFKNIEALASGTSGQIELSVSAIENIKIPLPPMDVQKKIVEECEKIDMQMQQNKRQIRKMKEQAVLLFEQSLQKETTEVRLSQICDMRAGKFVPASEIVDKPMGKYIYPCYGGNGLRGFTDTMTNEGEYILIGRQGALCGNVCVASGQFHATEHAVVVYPNAEVDEKWLRYLLVHMDLNQYSTGRAQPGLSVQKILNVKANIPIDKNIQSQTAERILTIENEIAKLQYFVDSCPSAKQAILDKYLK